MTLSTTRSTTLAALQDLPEMTREAIVRGLSDVHIPDLTAIERPDLTLPDIDLGKTVGKAVTGVAVAVGLVRPARPRWPYVLAGAAMLAIGSWLFATNRETVRERIAQAVDAARERMASGAEGASDQAVAFTAAETAPIEPSLTNGTGSDYPDGLGDGNLVAPEAAVEATS
jgi:hypothetical protein